jgi:NitT/TauT family transport system ATP-binding protein
MSGREAPSQIPESPAAQVGRQRPTLEARELGVTYGRGERAFVAIESVSFEAREGFLCIVGPSGCGKTTLLRALSGLLAPTRGEAIFDGRPVTTPPKGLAFVFQDYSRSLMPWLTVARNVAFPLAAQGVPKREQKERVVQALREVDLEGVLDRYPWQLSGGMQQRVAIARAVACQPEVLLMDEPMASVDAQTRGELEDLVLRVQRDLGATVVFVTHDIDEAVYLGQRVLVLSSSPTTIRAAFSVDLPYPRSQVQTKALPEFVQLRTEIMELILSDRDRGAVAPSISAGHSSVVDRVNEQ